MHTARVHVLHDSVLCLGKDAQHDACEKPMSFLKIVTYVKERISGQPTECVWHVYPDLTVQLSRNMQHLSAEAARDLTPKNFFRKKHLHAHVQRH